MLRSSIVLSLPPLLSGKALIQEREDLGHIELDVFKVKLVLAIFLHLKQIVKLEVKFQKSAVAA